MCLINASRQWLLTSPSVISCVRFAALLFLVYRVDAACEFHVHADAPVIDLLITMPERQFCPLIIPLRQTFQTARHCLDIQSGVSNKAPPSSGGFCWCLAQFAVFRAWLTEQLDQRLYFLCPSLCLAGRLVLQSSPRAPGRPCASACTIVSRQRSIGGAVRGIAGMQ